MPYPGVPEGKEKEMERCVEKVMRKQGVSKSRAIAICRTSVVGKKDMSLNERDQFVRGVLQESLGEDYWKFYPITVYDSYVVVHTKGTYWQIGYAISDSFEIEFDEGGWIQVEHSFTPIEKMLRRDVDYPIKSADGGLFKAYAIRYGSSDRRDLDGNYFDENTNLYLDWYPNERPWLYHHGLHPKFKPDNHRIGYWTKSGEDDEGVFFLGELDERHRYLNQIELLLSKEYQFPSSGTLSYVAKADDDGRITDWPVVELSSTVRPCEHRMPAITPEIQDAMKVLATI